MKKFFLVVALACAMLFCLTGCGKVSRLEDDILGPYKWGQTYNQAASKTKPTSLWGIPIDDIFLNEGDKGICRVTYFFHDVSYSDGAKAMAKFKDAFGDNLKAIEDVETRSYGTYAVYTFYGYSNTLRFRLEVEQCIGSDKCYMNIELSNDKYE